MRVIRVLWVVVAVFGATGHADPARDEVDASAIPPGEGWWCFGVRYSATDGEFFNVSSCSRTKSACVKRTAMERSIVDRKRMSVGGGSYDCKSTKRVAAFTYHIVVTDVWAHLSYETMVDCESARSTYLTSDYDNVSKCGVVGASPPAPFVSEYLPEGAGWFCARFAGDAVSSVCRRAKSDCVEALQDRKVISNCAAQATAYAVSSSDAKGLWVFPTRPLCDDAISEIPARSLSACTSVK